MTSSLVESHPAAAGIRPVHGTEVAGIFGSYAVACGAARELYRAGFHHWDIFRSLPPSSTVAVMTAEEHADHPDAARTEHVIIEGLHPTAGYVTGGLGVVGGIAAAWVTGDLWGAAGNGIGLLLPILIVALFSGGGVLVGFVISVLMANLNRNRVIASAKRDGLVLWANARTAALEAAATEILGRHGAQHVHPVPPSH